VTQYKNIVYTGVKYVNITKKTVVLSAYRTHRYINEHWEQPKTTKPFVSEDKRVVWTGVEYREVKSDTTVVSIDRQYIFEKERGTWYKPETDKVVFTKDRTYKYINVVGWVKISCRRIVKQKIQYRPGCSTRKIPNREDLEFKHLELVEVECRRDASIRSKECAPKRSQLVYRCSRGYRFASEISNYFN
jgi:hypothetical protein